MGVLKILKNEHIDEVLGGRLLLERQKIGISQNYLGELLNRDQTYVSKIEKGRRQITVIDFLAWCRALNLSLETTVNLLKIGPYQNE